MAIQVTIRLPEATTERLDTMADASGLTRAQLVRMLLSRVDLADLPTGLVQHADRLRAARGVGR